VLDPGELLATARLLTKGRKKTTDADLRRAVSTAYYAVFHKIISDAVERFVGSAGRDEAAYAMLYRSFEHRRLKEVCKNLNKPTLGDAYRRRLRRPHVSENMRRFANAFPGLQELREMADYDPVAKFERSYVVDVIATTESAMLAFSQTTQKEQTDIMVLMMVETRA